MKNLIQQALLIFLPFVASIILMKMALPKVIRISEKKKLFDFPDERKTHIHPIPRLGGITFAPIILVVLVLSNYARLLMHSSHIEFTDVWMLVGGSTLIFMLGLNDDLGGVNFVEKLFIQFLAALFLMSNNVSIHNLDGLFGIYELSYPTSIIITVLTVIFTTNAMNLIDGADGLASGISFVALILYAILFSLLGMWEYVAFCVITIGVLIPFFYYNFGKKQCHIFMGDTGSLTLGYTLSFLMIRLFNQTHTQNIVPDGFIILVFSGLSIPLFDAARVLLARILTGKNPFSADRNHVHHRIIDLGIQKKWAVIYLLLVSSILIVLNWALLKITECSIVFLVDIILFFLLNAWIDFGKKKKQL